jgi:filamentous hemagglutinin family protein
MNSWSNLPTLRVVQRLRQLVAAVAACTLAANAIANPTGAQVVAGQVGIVSSSNQLLITNSPGAIINWQSFSVLPGELTRFIQQGASSSVLNRIIGQDPTQILGALQSNGKVFLINPNGILFGKGSQLSVNGLVASSLNLSDADFLAGKLKFSAAGKAGNVSNQGAITTPSGGQVYLIAPNVTNEGLITSPGGDVVLAAGQSVDLADSNEPDVRVVISAPGNQALNVGKVVAESGHIGIYGALVNQMGFVSANSAAVGENGKIVFKSTGDTTLGAGSVTTATGAGSGGEIDVLGNRVALTSNAVVDVSGQTGGGTVLIGGDAHGSNPAIQNAALTYVGPMAQIKADALQSGDGGKVIVWSNQQTQMYGDISARGGDQGGNGGFVETSSRNRLDFQGQADLRAPSGSAGSLLLDPSDITIDATPSSADVILPGTAPFTITAANQTSTLSTADLQNELGLGNVTVSTSSGAAAPKSGTITVAAPVTWSNSNSLTLAADQDISINAPITAATGTLVLAAANGNVTQALNSGTPAAISVAALAASAPNGSVTLTEPTNSVSGSVAGVGRLGFSFINSSTIAVGTVGTVSGISSNDGTVALVATSGNIVQNSGPISAGAVSALASTGSVQLNDAGNAIGTIAGSAAQGFSLTDSNGFVVGAVAGTGNIPSANGINTSNASGIGVVLQTSGAGDITLAAPVNAGTSTALVSAAGAVVQGTGGLITAGTLNVDAAGAAGIGSNGAPLLTAVNTLQSANSPGSVYLSNSGNLSVDFISAGGVVNVNSGGSLTTPTAIACDCTRSITGSSVTLAAKGTMLITAGYSVTATDGVSLYGGYDVATGTYANSANSLTVDGNVTATTIGLFAGGTISANGTLSGVVTQSPSQYAVPPSLPSLAQCIATPTLEGCAAVLPSIAQCVSTPTAPGCSVVLPTLAQCTATPTAAGCTVVLPTLAQCTATPTAAGCSVVLPTLAQCISSPTAAGCSVVLPTVAQCTATPTASGCSVVLPTLAQCISSPTAAGCSVVLPTVAQCTTTPTAAGCSAVLPTLAQCISSPTTAGCTVVLPTVAQCTATPTTAGCSAVLPSLAQCTSAPALAGCAAVLPTLAQCAVTPTLAGCSAVLPTLAQCTSTPSQPGCSSVLPPPSDNSVPLKQASNLMIVSLNTTVTILSNGGAGSSGQVGTPPKSSGTSTTGTATTNPGASENEPPKKLYCN